MRTFMSALVLALTLSSGALAVSEEDREACDNPSRNPDVSIAACSAIIDAVDVEYVLNIAYFNRGVAYVEKSSYERAIADFDEAINLSPENADAYFHRGTALGKRGEYDSAIADFSQVISINPNDADAFVKRGNTYKSKGDYGHALADFEAALRIAPNLKAAANEKKIAIEELAKQGGAR